MRSRCNRNCQLESPFVRTTDKLFYVQAEDDVLIRQRIEQLIEFLNDALGVNSLGGAQSTATMTLGLEDIKTGEADTDSGWRGGQPGWHAHQLLN